MFGYTCTCNARFESILKYVYNTLPGASNVIWNKLFVMRNVLPACKLKRAVILSQHMSTSNYLQQKLFRYVEYMSLCWEGRDEGG